MAPHFWTALWALTLGHAVVAAPQILAPRATGSLDTWLAAESAVARQGILDNIGSAGAHAANAKPGIVVASPSTSDPNCKLSQLFIEVQTNRTYRLLYLDSRLGLGVQNFGRYVQKR